MKKLLSILLFVILTACDPPTGEPTEFRDGPPVPAGKYEGDVPEASYALKILQGCLPEDAGAAAITFLVTSEVDGNDVQRVEYTIGLGVHEDEAACFRDNVLAW